MRTLGGCGTAKGLIRQKPTALRQCVDFCPHSTSVTAVAAPPSPREKVFGEFSMERNGDLTKLAKELRKHQTKEEALLWYNFLRLYPLRFHRQYVIGNYIVDFYCHQAKLVIELDGSQHYEPKSAEKDEIRTAFLQSVGLHILRFTNLEIIQQFSAVCEMIDNEVRKRDL